VKSKIKITKETQERVKEFKNIIIRCNSALILAHDYPDPDSLGSCLGISRLLSFWGIKNHVISFGGFVGRAENRAMIRYLNINTIPFALIDIRDYEKIILIDCSLGRGNISLPLKRLPDAVIDHHQNDSKTFNLFYDIRPQIGSTSTIVTEYLIESNCPLDEKTATALYYGIKTDTGDLGRESTADDLKCYKYLFNLINHELLAKIENPERDSTFFKTFYKAAKNAIIFEKVAYIPLENVFSPDYIAEMADMFHSLEHIDITICWGIFKKNIFFSIRAKNSGLAGTIAENIAKALGGSGGGHGKAGAGKIQIDSENKDVIIKKFFEEVKKNNNIKNVNPVFLIDI
jgi:nanoRNase/pAp phosphatase (c-di-AMP/oligoRNAs hydrolase)